MMKKNWITNLLLLTLLRSFQGKVFKLCNVHHTIINFNFLAEFWIFTTRAEICLILFLFYLCYVKFLHTFGGPKKKKRLAPGVFESELLPYIFYYAGNHMYEIPDYVNQVVLAVA